MSICFVTDSAADIPAELAEELGIQILPFHIDMEGRDLRDGVDFTPQEFYQALLSAPKIPTHSQHTAFVFQECYEKAWREGYTDLIYTAINSKGSTTHANAVQAVELFYDDFPEARDALRIRVIDGGDYTMTNGWAVVLGARMAHEGKSAEETAAAMQDWVDHAQVVFGLYDLKFAKKSGRVSAAAAFVGDALGLKPIMTFQNGESKILTKVRGEKNVIPAILDQIKPAIDRTPPICASAAHWRQKISSSAPPVRRCSARPPSCSITSAGSLPSTRGPTWWALSSGKRSVDRGPRQRDGIRSPFAQEKTAG